MPITLQRFQDDQRSAMVQRYLEAHGAQTLESLKGGKFYLLWFESVLINFTFPEGFRRLQLELPFAEMGDAEVHNWLRSINGIDHRKVNGVSEFSLGVPVDNKRKSGSPLPSPPPKTPRKTTPRFDGQEITSTTLRGFNRMHQPIRNVRKQRNRQFKLVS